MSRPPDLDTPSTMNVEDAAVSWLLAHDDGMSDSRAEQFEAWLAASPEHQAAWNDLQYIWATFDQEPDDLLQSIHHSALSMRPSPWTMVSRYAAAAAVVLAAGLASWHWVAPQIGQQAPQEITAVPSTLYEAPQARREVALADGSTVLLDVGSRLSVRFSQGRRDVSLLAGQAFFRVAHDAAKPFVVAAADHEVVATGTAFAVDTGPGSLSVILVQGRVRVARDDHRGATSVDLAPGQEYRADGSAPATVVAIDVDAALAWRSGFLQLDDVPIREAVRRMNRYARVPLSVGDERTGGLLVSGRFRTDDPLRFAQTLTEIYPVRLIRRADGGWQIAARS